MIYLNSFSCFLFNAIPTIHTISVLNPPQIPGYVLKSSPPLELLELSQWHIRLPWMVQYNHVVSSCCSSQGQNSQLLGSEICYGFNQQKIWYVLNSISSLIPCHHFSFDKIQIPLPMLLAPKVLTDFSCNRFFTKITMINQHTHSIFNIN